MKGAIDPVTESDFESQEMIIALIRQTFPDHVILAEETLGEAAPPPAGDSPYRWIIDPLDGTVNFAHGYPAFCVSIACEAAGGLQYGVVYDPLRDELFEARKGQGAWLNGRPIRVSTTDRLERALVATGFPYDIRERLPETLAPPGANHGDCPGAAPGRLRGPGYELRGLRPLRRLLRGKPQALGHCRRAAADRGGGGEDYDV